MRITKNVKKFFFDFSSALPFFLFFKLYFEKNQFTDFLCEFTEEKVFFSEKKNS
jgi:hypothetical protein